ncbi:MAG: cell division protein FtsZ [Rhodobacteraceae bacterium]|nr:cell division protein FtsZ [Paracoccaceae bacterium]
MALNLSVPEENELRPRITVFGVGGAGGNAVNNMIEKQLEGVEFVVANTDAQALQQNQSASRIQLGVKVTEGLGAGARAEVGAAAAEESIEQIVDHLAGAHMCFITAGMGGGTGTGAAPIIAQAARELGVLTVGVVTKPFQFEGVKRMRQAEAGVEALQNMADDVLYQGVKGVTDLMVRPGLINLDFADVRAVMDEMGKAMMGTGEAEGEDRAKQAAEKAIANPLLDEISLRGARGVLINITGGYDLTLFELDEAANRIREEVDPDANIIVGSTLDPDISGVMRVSVVATGIDVSENAADIPVPTRAASAFTPAAPVVEEVAESEPAVAAEEPGLFDPSPAAAAEEAKPMFAPASEFQPTASDEPAPAYQPEVAEDATDAVVAPKAPAPGTPSEDAMARLRTAGVARTPEQVEEEPAESERPRFGIGSLINRMSGGSETTPKAQPLVRSQPAMSAPTPTAEEVERSQEQEKIEIPAFLRRQAN